MKQSWPFQAADVAHFLQQNPQFFEEYADLIADIFLPHPHHGQAIPLAERQMLTLRKKNQQLEKTLKQWMHYGTENDQLSHKIHRFTLALIAAYNREAVLNTIQQQLSYTFNVSHSVVRLWWSATLSSQTDHVEKALKDYCVTLQGTVCTAEIPAGIRRWFGDHEAMLQSFALIPLGKESVFGTLVLASVDRQRFTAEHDTFYLTRLREVVSEALLAKHS